MAKQYTSLNQLQTDLDYIRNAINDLELAQGFEVAPEGGVPMFKYQVKGINSALTKSNGAMGGEYLTNNLAAAIKSALGIGNGINPVFEGVIDNRLEIG